MYSEMTVRRRFQHQVHTQNADHFVCARYVAQRPAQEAPMQCPLGQTLWNGICSGGSKPRYGVSKSSLSRCIPCIMRAIALLLVIPCVVIHSCVLSPKAGVKSLGLSRCPDAGGQWYYDTNERWVAFTPLATDLLVAQLDYSRDLVRMTHGHNEVVHGAY